MRLRGAYEVRVTIDAIVSRNVTELHLEGKVFGHLTCWGAQGWRTIAKLEFQGKIPARSASRAARKALRDLRQFVDDGTEVVLYIQEVE